LWVETKNTTLEEIAVYFDGEQARVSGGELSMRVKLDDDVVIEKGASTHVEDTVQS